MPETVEPVKSPHDVYVRTLPHWDEQKRASGWRYDPDSGHEWYSAAWLDAQTDQSPEGA